jgi:hypothetical protein
MNDSLKVFLISSVKTALISGVIAGIAFLLSGNIIVWFVVGMASQYVLFYLLNSYLDYTVVRDSRVFQLKEAEIMAQNTVTVECA